MKLSGLLTGTLLFLAACSVAPKKQASADKAKRQIASASAVEFTLAKAQKYGLSIQDSKDLGCIRVGFEGGGLLAWGTVAKRYVDPHSKCVWNISCDVRSGASDDVGAVMTDTVTSKPVDLSQCADVIKLNGGFCTAEKMKDPDDPLADCLRGGGN